VGRIVGFGLFDTFLEFVLKDFSEEGSSLDEEKRFEVIECFSEGGVEGDEIALVEQSVKLFREKVADTGRRGLHKILPCKRRGLTITRPPIVHATHKIWTHPSPERR
jgi:hypothetical protein